MVMPFLEELLLEELLLGELLLEELLLEELLLEELLPEALLLGCDGRAACTACSGGKESTTKSRTVKLLHRMPLPG